MIYKEDIEKIREFLYDIEGECDYQGNWIFKESSVEAELYKIQIYLEARGYKIYRRKGINDSSQTLQ